MSYIRWEKCGHRRTAVNTDKRGGCRTCAGKGLRELQARRLAQNAPLSPASMSIRFAASGTATHFPCGHERSEENSAPRGQKRLSDCRACARQRDKKRYLDKFKCGHPKTDDNCVPSGSNSRTCRTCKAARDHQYNINKYQARKAREAFEARRKVIPATPAAELYRIEKAMAEERRQKTVLAEAKREYDAMLEREAQARKGGRPKSQSDFRGGRPNQMGNLRSDPADALLNALGTFEGAA